jgi:hypothetical protein
VVAVTVLVAGCGSEPEQTSAELTPTPSTTATRTPETSPTPTASSVPTTSTPTPTPTPTPVPQRGVTDRLLPAEQLPGFNETFAWTVEATAPSEPTAGVMCHSFDLLSIGAKEVAHRTYLPADGSPSGAVEIVADFPDPMTAKRARSVLQSWYRNCPRDHDGDPHLGPYTPVPLSTTGSAGWQLLTYGSTFDAHGFVQRGPRVAVVVLTLREAQDYNYEAGQEPMVAALQRAAALL